MLQVFGWSRSMRPGGSKWLLALAALVLAAPILGSFTSIHSLYLPERTTLGGPHCYRNVACSGNLAAA